LSYVKSALSSSIAVTDTSQPAKASQTTPMMNASTH